VKIQQLRKLNKTGRQKCEICDEQTILEVHHIRGKKVLNANFYNNLANICPNCHTKVHNGIIVIEKRVLTDKGYMLLFHHYKNDSFTGDDAKPWLI